MKSRVLLLLLCTVLGLVLAACHDDDGHSVLPSPIPGDTPCPDGTTRALRKECLVACKRGCVETFPFSTERRQCLEDCRAACYERYPIGCAGE